MELLLRKIFRSKKTAFLHQRISDAAEPFNILGGSESRCHEFIVARRAALRRQLYAIHPSVAGVPQLLSALFSPD
tara:strand:+ start:165 stop:389 length:225 start_codon:yes stop_codon:yes gene_type:complete